MNCCKTRHGFSLLEVLVSISITMVIAAAVFQLFQLNEGVFHDQYLVTETQQAVRAAISQIAGEIRKAGQGGPHYAASYDDGPSESAVTILSGSNAARINFREGIAPADTSVLAPSPLILAAGTSSTLTVANAAALYNAAGASPAGRFVYIWGDLGTSGWGWVRASLDSVAAAGTVRVTVADTGSGAAMLSFPQSPQLSLEEAVAIYLDSATGSLKRTTASNLSDPLAPGWAPANELMSAVTVLHFDYFDANGNAVEADSLAHRAQVARVDIRLAAQTTSELRNHSRPTYALAVRTNIRNR